MEFLLWSFIRETPTNFFLERRNIFAGSASGRFQRASGNWGIGLGDRAQKNLKAMNAFLNEADIFSMIPYEQGCEPVGPSQHAYCLADIGKSYAVYFPHGRYTVDLDPCGEAEAQVAERCRRNLVG